MSGRSLLQLKVVLRKFASDREWGQYHSPKNLAMVLAAESGELLEQFQWLAEAESSSPDIEKREAIADELADILNYLVCLADKLDIDLIDSAFRKIEKNAEKYPAGRVRGSMKKYTEYH